MIGKDAFPEHRPDGSVSHGVEKGTQWQCMLSCDQCVEGTGWVWKHSDLGHTNHRGKMWAEQCTNFPAERKVWDSEIGEFRPPAPIGIEEERMYRYMTHDWDANRSKDSFSSENRHERQGHKQQGDGA